MTNIKRKLEQAKVLALEFGVPAGEIVDPEREAALASRANERLQFGVKVRSRVD
jgi:hypothetical protein